MSLWGANNIATAMPKFLTQGGQGGDPRFAANAASTHGNTVFAVPASKEANTKAPHAGWNVIKKGTGFVAGLTITAAGSGYSNTDFWRANTGTTEANGTIVTNGSGAIISYTVKNAGAGFTALPTVAIANSTGGASAGSNATLTAVAGGRIGRVSYETIVASGSLTANGGGSEFSNLV